jgi:hypothetical protein
MVVFLVCTVLFVPSFPAALLSVLGAFRFDSAVGCKGGYESCFFFLKKKKKKKLNCFIIR